VGFDEKGDDRRFSWRFSVGDVVEGDGQARRGLGPDHPADGVDGA